MEREGIDKHVLSVLLHVVMGVILLVNRVLGISEPSRGSLFESADSDIVMEVVVYADATVEDVSRSTRVLMRWSGRR